MKTFELQGHRLDALVEVIRPDPVPGARELLLRTRAVALNYRDLAIVRGEYGGFPLPLVPASDAVADVVATGNGVSRFAVGDRVCMNDTPDWITGPVDEHRGRRRLGGPLPGVLAELLVASEEAVVAAPAHLDDAEAATLCGAGVTAWQALFVPPRVTPGQVVVVQGTGGVSVFAVQLACLARARVIVLSRSASKLDRMRAIGATDGIDTTASPDWAAEVHRLTNGRGADVTLDVLGGRQLDRSIAATRVGGTVIVLGFVEGAVATVDLPAAIRRGVTLQTSTGRSRDSFEALVRALENSKTRPVVDKVFAWDKTRDAFEYLGSGAHLGKVVIRTTDV